jgi:ferrous iron transport protein B
MSTMAVVKRETGSWKYPIAQFFYMGAIAYLFSWVAFQILS